MKSDRFSYRTTCKCKHCHLQLEMSWSSDWLSKARLNYEPFFSYFPYMKHAWNPLFLVPTFLTIDDRESHIGPNCCMHYPFIILKIHIKVWEQCLYTYTYVQYKQKYKKTCPHNLIVNDLQIKRKWWRISGQPLGVRPKRFLFCFYKRI